MPVAASTISKLYEISPPATPGTADDAGAETLGNAPNADALVLAPDTAANEAVENPPSHQLTHQLQQAGDALERLIDEKEDLMMSRGDSSLPGTPAANMLGWKPADSVYRPVGKSTEALRDLAAGAFEIPTHGGDFRTVSVRAADSGGGEGGQVGQGGRPAPLHPPRGPLAAPLRPPCSPST